jgi:transposase InsO family protein
MSGIYQKCIEPEEGRELLREIHQGECGHHASSRALVAKAFRHGFYWPTTLKDAKWLVKSCNGCQCFCKQRHTPAAALKTIPLTWPFAVWGLDMVGLFKMAPRGLMHLLIAVDKFTKWIEAKPIKKLDGSSTIKFFNEIIVRYGLPHSIITDNGTNFAKGVFAEFCGQKGIQLDLALVAHPQSNGQVEKANGLVLAGNRPRLVEPLERSANCWVKDLLSVLWSLRTTPNRYVVFTPFFLVYGAEALLPTDIKFDVPRVVQHTEEEAKRSLRR